eukprot:scaffold434_cov186-Pinguiococcus_pyrenoidosus.AAC.95
MASHIDLRRDQVVPRGSGEKPVGSRRSQLRLHGLVDTRLASRDAVLMGRRTLARKGPSTTLD